MIAHEHERIWKEVTVLAFIAIFSIPFYHDVANTSLYATFGLLGIVLYFIVKMEEKPSKGLNDYFHHMSSYFLLSVLFFAVSYLLLTRLETTFVMFTVAIAIILFSMGFMGLLFIRLEK